MGLFKVDLFIDFDDTIVNSTETIIKILNERNKTSKTMADLRGWNFEGIAQCSRQEVLDFFSSQVFFDRLTFQPGFSEFLKNYAHKFNLNVVSFGTKENLEKKREWLQKNLPKGTNYHLLTFGSSECFDKSSIDMSKGIQIDDRIDCLKTNAPIKILLKEYELPWNQTDTTEDNLYITNSWKEINNILTFFCKNKEFITPCY